MVLLCVAQALGWVAGGATAFAVDEEEAESSRLVSVVFGCLEVPEILHSFTTTNLRDAFSGTIAESAEAKPILHWMTGLWDFDGLLESFERGVSIPEATSSVGAPEMWFAHRDGVRFVFMRYGRVLMFGEAPRESDVEALSAVFSSYRGGSKNCAGAQISIPVASE